MTHNTVVKGDATYMSIAAASILAKTYRDDYMMRLAQEYPMYDWQSNKGYPTAKHRTRAISPFWLAELKVNSALTMPTNRNPQGTT